MKGKSVSAESFKRSPPPLRTRNANGLDSRRPIDVSKPEAGKEARSVRQRDSSMSGGYFSVVVRHRHCSLYLIYLIYGRIRIQFLESLLRADVFVCSLLLGCGGASSGFQTHTHTPTERTRHVENLCCPPASVAQSKHRK